MLTVDDKEQKTAESCLQKDNYLKSSWKVVDKQMVNISFF